MSLDLLIEASRVLQSVRCGEGSIKNLCYDNRKSINKKQLYALVTECCRHFFALQSSIQTCTDFSKTDQDEPFWIVLLYEFISGKFHYDLNNKYVQLFWKHKASLKNDYSCALKLHPPFSTTDDRFKYLRVNRLIDADELSNNFKCVKTEDELLRSVDSYVWDTYVKDLIVLSPKCNVSLIPGVVNGALISQDKASCLPAFILAPPMGSQVIDCCAAPGNKTTQIAGYVGREGRVFAIERDSKRFEILKQMVAKSNAASIVECHNRDFLALDPHLPKYSKVEYALVDPSCSGSGMPLSLEKYVEKENRNSDDRLEQLARFQTMAIKHAMKFPKVKSVVYSTCSVNERENEAVVQEILSTKPEWTLATAPLPNWPRRGLKKYAFHQDVIRSDPKCDMMIGFFVALFVKKDTAQ